jgi:hypothetical protein
LSFFEKEIEFFVDIFWFVEWKIWQSLFHKCMTKIL